jgi:leader peptidase (prepilin peptidase) / N-methyltransferase
VSPVDLYVTVMAGTFGLLIGSFLNACAYRIPRDISIAHGRSFCPACTSQIAAYDNVPLVSWVALHGQCRACGAPISYRYPLVEGLTAVLFAAVAAHDGATAVLLPHLLFVAALVLVSDIDLAARIIPDVVILPVAAIGAVTMTVLHPFGLPWWTWLVSGIGAAAFLLAVSLVYEKLRKQEGMGMGDVKLALCMGFYLGPAVIPALFIGFISGAVAGIALMSRGRSAKTAIPFGPFLSAGAVVSLFAGQQLIDLYLRLMLPS